MGGSHPDRGDDDGVGLRRSTIGSDWSTLIPTASSSGVASMRTATRSASSSTTSTRYRSPSRHPPAGMVLDPAGAQGRLGAVDRGSQRDRSRTRCRGRDLRQRTDGKEISHAILCYEVIPVTTSTVHRRRATSTSTTSTVRARLLQLSHTRRARRARRLRRAHEQHSNDRPLLSLFSVGGAATVCDDEVPVITISFGNRPDLNGQVGSLAVHRRRQRRHRSVSLPLTFIAQHHRRGCSTPVPRSIRFGTVIDWPGWVLQWTGFWVIDPTDAFLREGLTLIYDPR